MKIVRRTTAQLECALSLPVVVVVVAVEWLYYSKRIIIVRWADLSDFFSLIFVGLECPLSPAITESGALLLCNVAALSQGRETCR